MIGNTPLIALSHLQRERGWQAEVLAKCEWCNPAGSAKDRAVQFMLDDALASGRLQAGGTVIEPTSGNTGIALAAQAAARGLVAVIVMPDNMSPERIALMRARGAEVVLTPAALGMGGAVERAKQLVQQTENAMILGQFENPANALAHYRTTGPEIWAQTDGKVDIFVAGVGTGGTITGTARFLKEKEPSIHIVAVEPAKSPLLSAGKAGSHGIQGIGANFVPKLLDRSLLDDVMTVTDEEAFTAARELARRFGILCGISAGANYHAAAAIAEANPEKTVVTLLPDSGTRYLSTGIFG